MSNDLLEMDYEYDSQADALFIEKKSEYEHNQSIEIDTGIIMDFDEKNNPAALEILDASKILNTSKFNLIRDLQGVFTIKITEKTISLEAKFKVKVHNKEQNRPLNPKTINEFNIPESEVELAIT